MVDRRNLSIFASDLTDNICKFNNRISRKISWTLHPLYTHRYVCLPFLCMKLQKLNFIHNKLNLINVVEFLRIIQYTHARVCIGWCRTSKSVRSLGREGVTRIPGAAVHVGLIDSQRRRARVTRHQLQCAYAHGQHARFMYTKGNSASFGLARWNSYAILAWPWFLIHLCRRSEIFVEQIGFLRA